MTDIVTYCIHGMPSTDTFCIRCRDEKRIAALEAQLRSLIDVATAALDMMLASEERSNPVITISEAREAMKA